MIYLASWRLVSFALVTKTPEELVTNSGIFVEGKAVLAWAPVLSIPSSAWAATNSFAAAIEAEDAVKGGRDGSPLDAGTANKAKTLWRLRPTWPWRRASSSKPGKQNDPGAKKNERVREHIE